MAKNCIGIISTDARRVASHATHAVKIGSNPESAAQRKIAARCEWPKTRISAPTAAILVQAAMNPVTGVGAPAYTSGVHEWNGTALNLNSSPTHVE